MADQTNALLKLIVYLDDVMEEALVLQNGCEREAASYVMAALLAHCLDEKLITEQLDADDAQEAFDKALGLDPMRHADTAELGKILVKRFGKG